MAQVAGENRKENQDEPGGKKTLPQDKGFLMVRERSAAEYRSRGDPQIGR